MNGVAGKTMTAVPMNGTHNNNNTLSQSLPQSTSPTLALGLLTPGEARNQAASNAASWRGPLTVEAYLRREECLGSQGLSKNGGITFWGLYDTQDEPRSRRVLAGCETLRKRALVSRNGKVEDIITHGIGSVFTPPEFRGRSYGGRMMAELGKKLETWQTEDQPCLFSVLYSDIGKKFYTKFGWRPYPSAHMHLRPEASPDTNGHTQSEAKPLYAEDLAELCAADEAMIRSKMAKHRTGTAVAILPDNKTIEWHHAREDFVSNELHGRKPAIKGALAQVGDDRVWCIWSRLWYNEDRQSSEGNTMYILRLVVENSKGKVDEEQYSEAHVAGIASVLQYAQREAHEWYMGEVELWNPSPSTVSAVRRLDPEAKVVERDTESIASLRWHGSADEHVEWLDNEKYGWC